MGYAWSMASSPEVGTTVATEYELLHAKLDKIIEFQETLRSFLPLLVKVAGMVDNPATRFREAARMRKAARNGSTQD